jgi:hypothetical protein
MFNEVEAVKRFEKRWKFKIGDRVKLGKIGEPMKLYIILDIEKHGDDVYYKVNIDHVLILIHDQCFVNEDEDKK